MVPADAIPRAVGDAMRVLVEGRRRCGVQQRLQHLQRVRRERRHGHGQHSPTAGDRSLQRPSGARARVSGRANTSPFNHPSDPLPSHTAVRGERIGSAVASASASTHTCTKAVDTCTKDLSCFPMQRSAAKRCSMSVGVMLVATATSRSLSNRT
jgi:hypothetical protein